MAAFIKQCKQLIIGNSSGIAHIQLENIVKAISTMTPHNRLPAMGYFVQ